MPEGCTSKTLIDDIHVDVADLHTHLTTLDSLVSGTANMLNTEIVSYGLAAGLMSADSLSPVVVTGGNAAYGTQVLLFKGGSEIADSKTYWHLRGIQVNAVTEVDKNSILKFYLASKGSAVAYTMEADDETVTAAGHGLVNGNMVIFDTMSPDETHGVTKSIVYFVRDMSGSTFKVALTSTGDAVAIDADLSGNIRSITLLASDIGSIAVSRSSLTCDSNVDVLPCSQRVGITYVIFAAAKSEVGSAVGISFFMLASGYNS